MIEVFDEGLHAGVNLALEVGTVLYRDKTEHQDLMIFENNTFGRVMSLDGAVQTTEMDEFIYHEMIAHVPLLTHQKAKRVLVIGGGDGGTVREVLKHQHLETVTMVELDEEVIKASKLHLPNLSKSLSHPKLEVIFGNGIQYLKESSSTSFDVILVDTPSAQQATDAQIVAQKTHAAMIVGRKDKTQTNEIVQLTQVMGGSGIQILGATLNNY